MASEMSEALRVRMTVPGVASLAGPLGKHCHIIPWPFPEGHISQVLTAPEYNPFTQK